MPNLPAARVGDEIAHSNAGLGMGLGIGLGLLAGVVLVGATIATGGAALAVVAAVGGAAAMTSAGGLGGMYIGEADMGPPCGDFVTGSANVFVNSLPATFTFGSTAACQKDNGPQQLATGAATVTINFGLAGRENEKLACSAKSIPKTSPNVFIGGESAQDPRVELTPEVPQWAVTGLMILGVAGAIMTLPFSVAAVGIGGTLAITAGGVVGSAVLGYGGRLLGNALGLSEAGTRGLEVGGGIVGGALGGRGGMAGMRSFRRNTAHNFYARQGMPPKDIPDHLKGIDFNKPVSVQTIPKNTPVTQYQVPGGRQGNYYAPPGTPASQLGINPQGVSRTTGNVVNKPPTTYRTTRDVSVLKSTAASVDDTWSVPGRPYRAEGGATQFFTMDRGALAP